MGDKKMNYSQVSRHKKAHFFKGAGYLVCSQYKASASFGVSILNSNAAFKFLKNFGLYGTYIHNGSSYLI